MLSRIRHSVGRKHNAISASKYWSQQIDWNYLSETIYDKSNYKLITTGVIQYNQASSTDEFKDEDWVEIIYNGAFTDDNTNILFCDKKGMIDIDDALYGITSFSQLIYYKSRGVAATATALIPSANRHLRMRRSGTTIVIEYSDNGTDYTEIHTYTNELHAVLYVSFMSGSGTTAGNNVVVKRNRVKVVNRTSFGELYNSIFTSTNSYARVFTRVGTGTYTISNNTLITPSSLSDYTRLIRLNWQTALEKWDASISFKTTVSATSIGIFFGIRSVQTNHNFYIVVNAATGVNLGKIFIVRGGTNVLAASTSGMTIATNDIITLTVNRNKNSFTVNLANVTQSLSNSLSYTIDLTYGDINALLPYTGYFALGSLQTAAITITDLKISSQENVNNHLAVVGDSITSGVYATTLLGRYAELITTKVKSIFGGPGDAGLTTASRITEVCAAKPNNAVILVGSNFESDANYQAGMTTILDRLLLAGITKITLVSILPRDDADVRSRNTVLAALAVTYGLTLVDCFNGMCDAGTYTLKAAYTGTLDNIHPNNDGHTYIANTIRATVPSLI